MLDNENRSHREKEEWLNEMFTPLHRFFNRNQLRDSPEQVAKYLMFVDNSDGRYVYKNKVTRSCIVLDEQGFVITCAKDALNTLSVYKAITPERKRRKSNRLLSHSLRS